MAFEQMKQLVVRAKLPVAHRSQRADRPEVLDAKTRRVRASGGMQAPRAALLMVALSTLVSCLIAAPAQAALVIQSTVTSGTLQYVGLGDVGGGIGSGRYKLGNCAFDSGITTCTLSGSYVETADSTHAPGQQGTFAMTLAYPGSGVSPVIAKSTIAGSDVLQIVSTDNNVFTLTLFPSVGGHVTGFYPDPVFANSILFSAFLDPDNYGCTGLAAGQLCSIGQVGLVPGAIAAGGVKPLLVTLPAAPPATAVNYEGLWWKSPAESESGWGLNVVHQGDTIFATWFTYDTSGKPWWLSMTANKTADATYAGTLYQTHGPAFSAVPFVPSDVTRAAVGTGTLAFSGSSAGTFTYTVTPVGTISTTTQTKTIIPQAFAALPNCVFGAQSDLTTATNFQDLWWASPAGAEAGWGVNVTQQGTTIFATWFTYDVDHNPLWYSVTAPQTGANTFVGTLNKTAGPAFNAVPFDPALVTHQSVGTATFTFTNGDAGTFAYDVHDGSNVATQTKPIVRQVFQSPGTVCH